MKKLALILLALMLTLTCISCSKEKTDAPAGMKDVSNGSSEFQLFIPEEWIVDRSDGMISAHVSEKDSTNVSVTAFAFPINEYNSLEEYLEKEYMTYFENNFSDMVIVEEFTECKVDGRDARSIVFTATVGANEYKFKQIITTSASAYLHIFTYTSSISGFDAHLEDLNNIIKEFRFL